MFDPNSSKKTVLTNQKKPFWELQFEDFELHDYKHHPVIKFPVAV